VNLRLCAVEFEEAREDFFVGDGGVEAVSRGDRRVEFGVRVREPSGTLVVEVRERVRSQLARRLFIAGEDAGAAHMPTARLPIQQYGEKSSSLYFT
jgi:hypothetical protein